MASVEPTSIKIVVDKLFKYCSSLSGSIYDPQYHFHETKPAHKRVKTGIIINS